MLNNEDRLSLKLTLDRIDMTMNQRFEKDADLYMSIEDQEKVKHCLYSGNYIPLSDWHKSRKYSADILTKVLIQNSWLIMKNNKFAPLNSFINECDSNLLYRLLKENVFIQKVDMPKEFRKHIIKLFLQKADSISCQDIMDAGYSFLYNPELYAYALRACLKEYSGVDKYNKFISYLSDGHENLIQSKELKVVKFSESDMTSNLYNIIYEKHLKIESEYYFYWRQQIEATHGVNEIITRFAAHICRSPRDFKIAWNHIKPMVVINKDIANSLVDEIVPAINQNRAYISKYALQKIYDALLRFQDIADLFANNVGLVVEQHKKLTLDEIRDEIDDAMHDSKYMYLVKQFDQSYRNNAEDNLNYIYNNSGNLGKVATFLVTLSKVKARNNSNTEYLIYTINDMEENENNYSNSEIQDIISHIAQQDFLRNNRIKPEWRNIISDFLRERDFKIFKQCTE
ncbi:MAG: hypothetical protein SO022_03915 [Selenomonadaceae bacterium]|nr:hypothetical protein [Selenomonadaceae bacterium]